MFHSLNKRRVPKRILIYRLGSLGDTVIALPALHLIAQAFPQAERRMLTTFPPNAKAPPSSAVLEHTSLIHGYFRYAYGLRSPRKLFALWWQLVRWRPQVLVYLGGERTISAARRDAIFCRLAGISRIIGVPATEDMQRCRQVASAGDHANGVLTYEPESSRLVRNIAELGVAKLDDPASWDLRLTPPEYARAAKALIPIGDRPFIAVSLGTKNQANDWGVENWRALLGRVASLYQSHALVICGAEVEAGTSEAAAAGWREHSPNPLVNLCGLLAARESAAVFQQAAVFLGHDSGPMHLAAAVQTPCIAVFGARNLPGIWFPYGDRHKVLFHHVDCAGCGLQTCIVQKKRCILSITVDEVLLALMSTLPPQANGIDRILR